MAKKSVKQASAQIVKSVKAKAQAAGASAAAASVMAQTVKKAFEKEIDKKGLSAPKRKGPSEAQLAARARFVAMARAGKSRGAMAAMKTKTASGFTAKQLAAQRKFATMARANAKKPTAKQKAARKKFAASSKGFAKARVMHLKKLRSNPKRREMPLKVLVKRQVALTKLIRSRKSE